jgi:hypothetical protein
MAELEIEWSGARVDDGELVVELSEPPSAQWRKRATAALGLLQRSGQKWGDVDIRKDRIVVGDVAEGTEADVRHFVESIVLQANAGEREPEPEHRDDADARMTAAFQAFGSDRDG